MSGQEWRALLLFQQHACMHARGRGVVLCCMLFNSQAGYMSGTRKAVAVCCCAVGACACGKEGVYLQDGPTQQPPAQPCCLQQQPDCNQVAFKKLHDCLCCASVLCVADILWWLLAYTEQHRLVHCLLPAEEVD